MGALESARIGALSKTPTRDECRNEVQVS